MTNIVMMVWELVVVPAKGDLCITVVSAKAGIHYLSSNVDLTFGNLLGIMLKDGVTIQAAS